MRILLATLLVLSAWGAASGTPSRTWGVEVEWGDSIPAGTVLNVKFDSNGRFKAERRGLPIQASGALTSIVHEARLPAAEAVALRHAVERCIRSVDLEKAQGEMIGDGGYIHVYLWDGTVSLAVHVNRLTSYAGAGENLESLIGRLEQLLPEKFLK